VCVYSFVLWDLISLTLDRTFPVISHWQIWQTHTHIERMRKYLWKNVFKLAPGEWPKTNVKRT